MPKTKTVLFQCDNCPEPNKFDEVIVNLTIPGHNKFSVDGAFGVKKNTLRK